MSAVCPERVVDAPWSSPDGRVVLASSRPREEWLAARRTGIGSSDASTVLGLSKYSSPYEVWAEKRGLLPASDVDTDELLWGRLHEPTIATWWSAEANIPVRRAGLMRSKERPWQLASVDRLAGCGGLLEIKTLGWRVAEEWEDGQTPDHAEAQVQHQLAVTGRDHAHVVGLLDGRKPLVRTIARDDALIADMVKIEDEFWGWVLDGTEPPIDGSASTTDALSARWAGSLGAEIDGGRELAELREQKLAADTAVAQAEDYLGQVKNRIRALLGDATEGLVDDLEVATWRRNGAFSDVVLLRDHPELHAALQVPVQTTATDVDRLKAEHPDVYTACRARVLRVAKNPKTRKKETH